MGKIRVYSKEEQDGIWVHFGECTKSELNPICTDSQFKIRRPSPAALRELARKHRKDRAWRNPAGQWQQIQETDDEFVMAWMEMYVLDWKNILDETDQPVPFSKEALAKVLKSSEVVDFLLEILRAANLDAYKVKEAELGN